MIKIFPVQTGFRLYYQDKSWGQAECLNYSSFTNGELPAWVHRILLFCKEWLNGQETFYFQTSGSTGAPKTIRATRKQLLASVELTQKAFHLRSGEVALLCLPIDFIAGKMMLIRGMQLGWHIIVQKAQSNPLLNLQVSQKIDFAAFVPLQVQTILEQTPEKIHQLFHTKSVIIIGGASISEKLEKSIEKLEIPTFHTYAMTETLSHIAIRRLNGFNKQDYFQVLEGVKIRLDDRECLCIVSPTTNFQEIITNDKAELIAEDKFRIVGRIDNIINSGGVKIQLELVEKIVEKVFDKENITRRFFCTGIPDEKLGQKLVLCIEGACWDKEKEQDILQKINLQSPNKYFVPKLILYKESFVETSTGKIKRII